MHHSNGRITHNLQKKEKINNKQTTTKTKDYTSSNHNHASKKNNKTNNNHDLERTTKLYTIASYNGLDSTTRPTQQQDLQHPHDSLTCD